MQLPEIRSPFLQPLCCRHLVFWGYGDPNPWKLRLLGTSNTPKTEALYGYPRRFLKLVTQRGRERERERERASEGGREGERERGREAEKHRNREEKGSVEVGRLSDGNFDGHYTVGSLTVRQSH